jgi:uncharacterized membrane protein
MFKGEKTTTFWIGLVALVFSIFQFCQAIWQIFYYYVIYPELLGVSSDIFSLNFTRLLGILGVAVPSVIGGIIFLIVGLYIMKRGVKKNQPLTQQPEQIMN